MSSEKKFLPKLYPIDRDLQKTWFIQYTAPDGTRPKIYGKLNKLFTVDERTCEADILINSILQNAYVKSTTTAGNQLIKDLSEVFEIRRPNWKSKSVSAYNTHLTGFVKWFRNEGCPEIDSRQIAIFLNSIINNKCTARTRNNYYKNLRSLFNDLCIYFPHRYRDNPFKQIKKITSYSKTKDWFRPAQMAQVAEFIYKRDKALYLAVKIMFHCFIRPAELRQLKIGDINFDTKKIEVSGIIAKTKKTRHVPIPTPLLESLEHLKIIPKNYLLFGKNNEPGLKMRGINELSSCHKKIMVELNYSLGYTFYSWKNTGAVKMLMHDRKPIRYISKCMGHHSLDMTDRYFQSLGVDEMENEIIFPDFI